MGFELEAKMSAECTYSRVVSAQLWFVEGLGWGVPGRKGSEHDGSAGCVRPRG